MNYSVDVRQITGQPIAVVRRVATADQFRKVVPQACGEVWSALKENGITGAGRLVAIYLDDVCHLEIGAEIGEDFASIGPLIRSSTPAGLVAVTTHIGPYSQLSQAHQAIHSWCLAQGYRVTGPSLEIYGHWLDDPAKLQTDILYVVEPSPSI